MGSLISLNDRPLPEDTRPAVARIDRWMVLGGCRSTSPSISPARRNVVNVRAFTCTGDRVHAGASDASQPPGISNTYFGIGVGVACRNVPCIARVPLGSGISFAVDTRLLAGRAR